MKVIFVWLPNEAFWQVTVEGTPGLKAYGATLQDAAINMEEALGAWEEAKRINHKEG